MTLTFTHLDLTSDCSEDYVVVINGNNALSPEVGRYCGTTIPVSITSLGPALYVRFITDQSNNRHGFRAVYTKSTSGGPNKKITDTGSNLSTNKLTKDIGSEDLCQVG